VDETARNRIRQVLDDEIRPKLQGDGGDVEVVEIGDDGVVKVRLTGGCGSCPLAGLTMTMVVERILKENVPEVVRVDPVE
jgi:Fe-S cluster biogenesis protein NfuA